MPTASRSAALTPRIAPEAGEEDVGEEVVGEEEEELPVEAVVGVGVMFDDVDGVTQRV